MSYPYYKTKSWAAWFDDLGFANNISFFISWLSDGADTIWSNPWVRFFNAPLAIITSVFSVILAWRAAALSGHGNDIARAMVETLAGAAMLTAAIGVMAAAASFAMVAPILIAVAFGVKTLFSLGSAIYFAANNNPAAAASALFDATIGLAMTAVTITLLLVAAPVVQTAMAALAITVSAIGMISAIIRQVLWNSAAHGSSSYGSDKITNNAKLAKDLSVTPASTKQIEMVEVMLEEKASTSAQKKSAANEEVFEEEVVAVSACRM